MFVLKNEMQFDWPVKTKVPEGKKLVPLKFQATFNVVDQDVADELLVDDDTRDPKRFLHKALVRFEGFDVVDADGDKIDDDDERNAMIIVNPMFNEALLKSYLAGIAGYRAKN